MNQNHGERLKPLASGVVVGSFYRPPVIIGLAAAIIVAGLVVQAHPSGAQRKEKAPKSVEPASGNPENGKRLFLKDGCYECHGSAAQGGGYNGPRLAPDPPPLEFILSYVRKPTGEMPPYTAKVISDKDLTDIYAFLKSAPPPDPKSMPALNK